jgi:hypothetical protein
MGSRHAGRRVVTEPTPVRWHEVHVGDVVQGRNGVAYRVTSRAYDEGGSRWLAAGGGGRHDLFGLVSPEGRKVEAARPLGEVVPLLTRADRSDVQGACDALAQFGFEVTLIREDEPSMSPETTAALATQVANCRHDPELLSTLRDKRVWCTGCFTTISEPPSPELPVVVEAPTAPAEPRRMGVDASGTEWEIPAHVPDAESCSFGVHPVGAVALTPGSATERTMFRCGLCTTVFESTGEAANGALVTLVVSQMSDPAEVIPEPDAVNDDQLALLIVGETAPVVLSQPVDTVIVVNEPPPADVFSDPAPKPSVGDDDLIKNKRYWLPHPVTGVMTSFTRASTLAKVIASTYLLDQWELREVAYGVAISPDLVGLAASVIRDDEQHHAETKATLSEVVRRAKQRAKTDARANLGTALHAFTHRRARGEAIDAMHAPAALIPDLVAYEQGMRDHGLTEIPDLVERTVVSLALGCAGTFDRIVHQTGTVTNPHPVPYTILDLKTGKSLDFSLLEFAIQFAIYANAEYLYDKVAKTYQPFPGPEVLDRSRALAMHLPVGEAKATVWAINIDAGWQLAQVAEQARQARNNARGYGWLVQPDPETLLLHRISKAANQQELAALWERHNPAGQWTPTAQAAADARMVELSEAQ